MIAFTSYTKEELYHIMQQRQLGKIPESSVVSAGQQTIFWQQYSKVLVDALYSYTGSDIRMIKRIGLKIWPVFIRPIITGKYQVKDFVRIYRESLDLFISEIAMTDNLVDYTDIENPTGVSSTNDYKLPIQSKYILCAAYLASYNPPRYDIRFFSKAKEARAKRRDTGRRKQLKINPRMLAAPAFDFERMLAILHAIAPDNDNSQDGEQGFASNVDIGAQIATLTTLKLIVRTNNADPLDSRTRWKVNASWGLVKRMADEIQLAIEEYLIE